MSWTITPQQKIKGLLDEYTGAAAAYSLRDLSVLRNAPVVRVRRSSDDTEQDFTAAQVTDGMLTTFCGAGNGFVRTWYDQSGNGDHATQIIAANQPQIVNSGVLVIESGLPAVSFNGTSHFLNRKGHTYPITVFSVVKSTGNGIRAYFGHGTNSLAFGQQQAGSFSPVNSFWAWAPNRALTYGLANSYNTNRNLHSYVLAGNTPASSWKWYRNGADLGGFGLTDDSAIAAPTAGFIGQSGSSSELWGGPIQEIVIYLSSQSANRAAIESNINAHYSIY